MLFCDWERHYHVWSAKCAAQLLTMMGIQGRLMRWLSDIFRIALQKPLSDWTSFPKGTAPSDWSRELLRWPTRRRLRNPSSSGLRPDIRRQSYSVVPLFQPKKVSRAATDLNFQQTFKIFNKTIIALGLSDSAYKHDMKIIIGKYKK